ncbi:hypothetical protein EXIGLDRAFT_314400 [Exidia glandulosa HHB12029]|uniref:Mid2 domain-containing protein n=1 Tax=Exidia glandulosa HHB12029 TaxID=1314781 RepID=A0A165CYF1_EXIGL|nr:hypothetical protein EXIGLDRAFT_314400 [Exidia glandulosa HHB12029]
MRPLQPRLSFLPSTFSWQLLSFWVGRAFAQFNVTVEDSDISRVTYAPPDEWQSFSGVVTFPDGTATDTYYHGGTLRATRANGGSVSFTFANISGTHIYYMGDRNTDHGAIDIELDDEPAVRRSALSSTGPVPQVILFDREVDPSVVHTITVTNVDGRQMPFDCFIYTQAPLVSPTSTGNDSTISVTRSTATHTAHASTPATTSMSTTVSPGVIIGISFAFTILLGLVIVAIVYMIRRRRERQNRYPSEGYMANISPFTTIGAGYQTDQEGPRALTSSNGSSSITTSSGGPPVTAKGGIKVAPPAYSES